MQVDPRSLTERQLFFAVLRDTVRNIAFFAAVVSVFAALAPLKLVGRVLAVPFALIFLVDAATGLVSVVLGVGLTAWWIARWEKPAERPEFNSWSVGATIVRGFSVLFDLSCFYVLGRSSRWWGIG